MARELPWVHGELPWLSGPLYRVRSDAWPLVDEFLSRWDYRRVAPDGRAMTSNFHAHAELHTAFGFPDWCGHNWDAFNDLLRRLRRGERRSPYRSRLARHRRSGSPSPSHDGRSGLGTARLQVRKHAEPRSRNRVVSEHGHLRRRGRTGLLPPGLNSTLVTP